MPKGPNRKTMTCRLNKSSYAFIKAEADRRGVSMASLVRQIVETERSKWIAWRKERRG